VSRPDKSLAAQFQSPELLELLEPGMVEQSTEEVFYSRSEVDASAEL